MKLRSLLFAFVLVSACKENHQHDGVYIAEQPYAGIMKTWIIEGNSLTSYTMGVVKITRCRQYEDRIETANDQVYRVDGAGNVIIPGTEGRTKDEKLIRRSSNTRFTPAELERMIDEAMPPASLMKDRQPTP